MANWQVSAGTNVWGGPPPFLVCLGLGNSDRDAEMTGVGNVGDVHNSCVCVRVRVRIRVRICVCVSNTCVCGSVCAFVPGAVSKRCQVVSGHAWGQSLLGAVDHAAVLRLLEAPLTSGFLII